MSKVEQFERIRSDRRKEGLSIRELARRHKVHRRIVRQALKSAIPPPRKSPGPVSPALEQYKSMIVEWMIADQGIHRKQRHTARRIWTRLVDEHGAQVSESTVRRFVAKTRAELGDDIGKVIVAQSHEFGQHGEVDFGEFHAYIAGVYTKCHMFVMRLSASGKPFHRAFGNQAQEAFLEGHVLGFEHFGGVPSRISYDNLKAAVVKVLFGRARIESERFTILRSLYGFESFYCEPGVKGAHEKGGVEGEIGRFRRNWLVPVPRVESLAELNELIAAGEARDNSRHIDGRLISVADHFNQEAPFLSPLPAERFDASIELKARVDNKSRICVRQRYYSVPARFVGRNVLVRLGATQLCVLVDGVVVCRHERSAHRKSETLNLDHYLEVLQRKLGALNGATALAQAKASGNFSSAHSRYWDTARVRLGDSGGTKAIIEILLAGRNIDHAALVAALESANRAGIVDAGAIIIEARRLCDARGPIGEVIITDNCIPRPSPTIGHYDELLAVAQ